MKIEITNEILQKILLRYGIFDNIIRFSHIIESQNNEKGYIKFVTSVKTENWHYIVKLLRRDSFKRTIEEQSAFSEYLRANGIPTAKRYKSGNNYRTDFRIGEYILSVTVEDYIGEEITILTVPLAYKIGELLARMHNISERGDCHIHRGHTIFNITTENDALCYDMLLSYAHKGKIDKGVFTRIRREHSRIMKAIRKGFEGLPVYASQGDLSVNNLTLIDGEVAVFDYNICGDMPLLSDMILEGLLIAHEMEREDGLTVDTAYREFERGYFSRRPLSKREQEIYTIAHDYAEAVWFSKLIAGYNKRGDSFDELTNAGDTNGAACVIEKIARDLESIET